MELPWEICLEKKTHSAIILVFHIMLGDVHLLPVVFLDNDADYTRLLTARFQRVAQNTGISFSIVLCASKAEQVLSYASKHPDGNLYFLDIELQDVINGLAVAQQLHVIDPRGHIVFVSAYEHYIWEAMHAHVFDYLLKPLTDEAISACLQGVMKDRQEKPAFSRRLVVKSGERTLLLHQEEIIYLQVNGSYLTAVVTKGEPCKWYGRLQQIAPLLDERLFVQINRNCLVGIRYVQEIDTGESTCLLVNGEKLKISRRRAVQLKKIFTDLVKE